MVVDQTKIEGNYDIALQWQSRAGESDEDAIKRAVLEQLGLEFIPSRESIKYLVIEKLE